MKRMNLIINVLNNVVMCLKLLISFLSRLKRKKWRVDEVELSDEDARTCATRLALHVDTCK